MTHLIDTDICSFHFRRPGGLAHRFFQHMGGLAISAVSVAELFAGAYRRKNPQLLLVKIDTLIQDMTVIEFDRAGAEQYGRLFGLLAKHGRTPPIADAMNASLALLHNLTMVTHNTRDYQYVPGLRLDDWLTP
jgi:tRNA(fMet)-specific endonuclease VapC